jgi:hypothetical protein
MRRTGYLTSIDNIPPLIFRFQFNPDILSDRKSYKYDSAPAFGLWKFDKTSAGSGFFGTLAGLAEDVKEFSSLLVATKPLDPKEGEPRLITLEFVLDGTAEGPRDQGPHGSILPDIAVLRSFMYPSLSMIDAITAIANKDIGCWNRPPTCTVKYGHVSMTGVMTDLDIRVVSFFEDGDPLRAEVRATVKEQTFSFSPIIDTVTRLVDAVRVYGRPGAGIDVIDSQLPTFIADPIIGAIK